MGRGNAKSFSRDPKGSALCKALPFGSRLNGPAGMPSRYFKLTPLRPILVTSGTLRSISTGLGV
jgi:hypothetical protein